MVIKSPTLAYKVMSDIAALLNGKLFTLHNHQHVTYIAITTSAGECAYWSHDEDDCEIVIINNNRNVRQYLHNMRKRRNK